MTLKEIIASDREILIPTDISEVIGTDPQAIRTMARKRPDLLGFPVCVVGSRVKIPRRAFIRFMTGEEEQYGNAAAGM